MFSKILVANRGEIACRIMRTARRLGVGTVAVYSDPDRGALHVTMADEAFRIGPATAAESYLNIESIIDAAVRSGAEAIHPGYGFLSENPDFVEAVEAAGLTFIGPSADAIRAMGLKDAAKAKMENAGVPVVPGYHGSEQSEDFLLQKAREIGFPVLIKARAGGGGKGMRLVEREGDFATHLGSAMSEAKASFGDPRVLIEKFITSPRHIEVQIFGDDHGNVVHLFERDCSLQRRHQKVIEEAPAPGMGGGMRKAMTDAAVAAGKAIGYSGAGTIEFIADGSEGLREDGFWFMEMNTRLQVEHPVTEMVTGLDLVEWQLRVAAGQTIPLQQENITLSGHAVEARLYAEDVAKGFLPASGQLDFLAFPSGVRADSGVVSGNRVEPYYDPMIAKVIASAEDRAGAIRKLRNGLAGTRAVGTVTNRQFLIKLLENDDFVAGRIDTGLIGRLPEADLKHQNVSLAHWAVAAWLFCRGSSPTKSADPFDLLGDFALWGGRSASVRMVCDGEEREIILSFSQGASVSAHLEHEASLYFEDMAIEEDHVRLSMDGHDKRLGFQRGNGWIAVFDDTAAGRFSRVDATAIGGSEAAGSGTIRAPMHGLVKRILVSPGQPVEKGGAVLVLEAMKMEHTLTSEVDGIVAEILVSDSSQVADGDQLIVVEEAERA